MRIDDLMCESSVGLTFSEMVEPLEGTDVAFFPPTFAGQGKDKAAYNIDPLADGGNVCIVDTVGSSANRREPMFKTDPYRSLIPQVTIRVPGKPSVNLVDAPHRGADALPRFSTFRQLLADAFAAATQGNDSLLARINPTGLVFGVWDSRGTMIKRPRLLRMETMAYNVSPLTRHAQYNPVYDFVNDGIVPEDKTISKGAATEDGTPKKEDAYSQAGLRSCPASGLGGVVLSTAKGYIKRIASLHLSALRLLRGANAEETQALRRYILGISLVTMTAPQPTYLRSGCTLISKPGTQTLTLVTMDGQRTAVTITHAEALAYAQEAAKAFGVGPDREGDFDPAVAVSLVKEIHGKKGGKKGGKKADAAAAPEPEGAAAELDMSPACAGIEDEDEDDE